MKPAEGLTNMNWSDPLRLCFYVMAGLIILGGTACAGQTDPVPQDDVFIPTSAWLVGPASLIASTNVETPCVMANQYNNGFLLRLSGGGQKLYAMAVDFRQQAFTVGTAYTVDLSIGDTYSKTLTADAYDSATLLINLQGQPALYKTMQSGGTMRLGIGKKTFEFALLGLNDGLKRLETCYNPLETHTMSAPGMQSSVAPRVPPIAGAADDAVDAGQTLNTSAAEADHAADFGMHMVSSPQVAPGQEDSAPASLKGGLNAPDQPAAALSQTADNAPAGLIDRMLKKAAVGIGAMTPASGQQGLPDALQPKAPRIVYVDPTGQLPVAQPQSGLSPSDNSPSQSTGSALAQTWTSDTVLRDSRQRDVTGGMARTVPAAQTVSLPADETAAAIPVPEVPSSADTQDWRAMSGSNLRDILTLWAQNNHAQLIWDMNTDFPVKNTIDVRGSFQTAVQTVLSQYSGDSTPPLAKLYENTAGQRVLLIHQN